MPIVIVISTSGSCTGVASVVVVSVEVLASVVVTEDGTVVGDTEDGTVVGDTVGTVGDTLGIVVGLVLGETEDGAALGDTVGTVEGPPVVGAVLGDAVGTVEGPPVVGAVLGDTVGTVEGPPVVGAVLGETEESSDEAERGDTVGTVEGVVVRGDVVGTVDGDTLLGVVVGLVLGETSFAGAAAAAEQLTVTSRSAFRTPSVVLSSQLKSAGCLLTVNVNSWFLLTCCPKATAALPSAGTSTTWALGLFKVTWISVAPFKVLALTEIVNFGTAGAAFCVQVIVARTFAVTVPLASVKLQTCPEGCCRVKV